MLDCISRPRPVLLGLAVVLLAGGVLSIPVSAQQQKGTRDDTETPFRIKYSDRFNKLRDGAAVDPLKDKDCLKVASQFFFWRLTWPGFEKLDVGLKDLQKDFNELMDNPATKSGKNSEFMKLLAHELVGRCKEVLDLDSKAQSAAVINAALLLPVLAKCKQNEVHEFLLQLAKADANGKASVSPFIRMCAIKGLGEFNGPGGPVLDNPNNFQEQTEKRVRELARLDAVTQFIAVPYPPEGTDPEHEAAFAYVRREGVKALARLRVPAYEIKKGKMEGPVAFYLLHIASGSQVKLGPPFTLAEKLEAAIALSQMKTADTPQYNKELAVFVVANALVEMATAYTDDYRYFSVKGKDKDAPKRLPILPWTSYATRFEEGLNTMAAGLPKGSAAAKNFDGLRSHVDFKEVLPGIKGRRKIDPPQGLQKYVATIQPPSFEVYQGIPGFSLK